MTFSTPCTLPYFSTCFAGSDGKDKWMFFCRVNPDIYIEFSGSMKGIDRLLGALN